MELAKLRRTVERLVNRSREVTLHVVAPGAETEWIVVPRDLQQASNRVMQRWSSTAARSALPRRWFKQHPKQFMVQASLAAAARTVGDDRQLYVLREALPGSFLSVELHWVPLGDDHERTLRELAEPSLKLVDVQPASVESARFVADLRRDHRPHGHITAFALGPLAVRVLVDLQPRSEERIRSSLDRLISSLTVAGVTGQPGTENG